jgi:transcription antitermination protein NusB
MLNRRVLRIKAMQALYALERSKASDLELAIDQIRSYFTPNLNADIIPDKADLKEKEKQAIQIFKENYDKDRIKTDADTSPEVREAVDIAFRFFHEKVNEDYKRIEKNLVIEAEQIRSWYLKLLQLLVVFADCVEKDIEKRKNALLDTKKPFYESERNLVNNVFVKLIREHQEIQNEVIRYGLDWSDDMIDVEDWFKNILKKDEQYIEYIGKTKPGFDDDYAMVDYIIKTLVFKNPLITEFFEGQDLYWSENKAALKSMIRKSLKSVEGPEGQLEVTRLSADWEEDKAFFKEIFQLTYRGDVEYEAMIARFAKNWDVERIAAVDIIILKMALCEMVNFMGIPVKVTINEYIDITKNYGTQKSKQFINGILDKAAQVLADEGKIRKSGRGLIDNK